MKPEYLLIAQYLLFASLPLAVGVQPSISDSWYALGKKHPLFTIWLCSVGMSIILIEFVITENPFFFVSGTFLCFCGVAAEFRKKMTGTVHFIGAGGGISAALTGLAIDGCLFPFWGSVAVIVACLTFNIKNKVWWIEFLIASLIIYGFSSQYF